MFSRPLLEKVQHDIPLEEDIQLAERSYPIQTGGWIVLFSFLVLALIGLFGDGWMSERKVIKNDVILEYERFGRRTAEINFDLRIQQVQQECIVQIPQHYFEKVELKSVIPKPKIQRGNGNLMEFVFEANGELNITMQVAPINSGSVKSFFRVDNNTIPFDQFFYP